MPDALIPHKTFTGNRPSSSIMLPDLSAYTTGQILALYEHVTAAMVRAQCSLMAKVHQAKVARAAHVIVSRRPRGPWLWQRSNP